MTYRFFIAIALMILLTTSFAFAEEAPAAETPEATPAPAADAEPAAGSENPPAEEGNTTAEEKPATTEPAAAPAEQPPADEASPAAEALPSEEKPVNAAEPTRAVVDPVVPAPPAVDNETCLDEEAAAAAGDGRIRLDAEGNVIAGEATLPPCPKKEEKPAAAASSAPSAPTEPPAADEEEDEEKEDEKEAATEPDGRMRFSLFGVAGIPTSDHDYGGGLGGAIGYDFYDKIGAELFLSQLWSGTKLKGASGADVSSDLKILSVKPGVRYRIWGENFRLFIMGHLGLIQIKWQKPPSGTITSTTDAYEEGFGLDAGFGAEYRFAEIIILELFATYEYGIGCLPTDYTGKFEDYHTILVGAGLGISSTL